MHNLAPNALETEFVLEELFIERMLAGQKRYEAEQKKKISVTTKPQELTTITQAPSFTHQEIEWLYCHGLYIGKEKIDTILSLPKDTLVQDLELVLQDSINRYYYFQKLTDDNGWVEEKMNFVIHSLYFLAELKASNSLDTIFNVASQSNEYLELYIGDFLSSSIWEIMYKIGANKLEAYKLFMFKPGVDTYARIIFADMVEQLAFHQPERRGEAINWYRDVLQFFLDSNIEDNVIDSDCIAFLICNVIDIKGSELLPEIEELYGRGLVSKGVIGNLEDIKKAFVSHEEHDYKREMLTMAERYEKTTSTLTAYKDEKINHEYDFDDYFEPDIMPVIAKPKIGRNQPCPCGSGKKYKKCCLNK